MAMLKIPKPESWSSISFEQWLCWGRTVVDTSWLGSWSHAACGARGLATLTIPRSFTPSLHRPRGSPSCEPTTPNQRLRSISISSSGHVLSCSTKQLSLSFSPPIKLLLPLPFQTLAPTVSLRIVAFFFHFVFILYCFFCVFRFAVGRWWRLLHFGK